MVERPRPTARGHKTAHRGAPAIPETPQHLDRKAQCKAEPRLWVLRLRQQWPAEAGTRDDPRVQCLQGQCQDRVWHQGHLQEGGTSPGWGLQVLQGKHKAPATLRTGVDVAPNGPSLQQASQMLMELEATRPSA